MTKQSFPRCAPEEIGVSSRQVMDCIRALEHDQTTMNGFVAARHGKVFAECWWSPYEPELVHCNHSLGKSYTATAVGIAIREGKLSLDTRLCDLFSAEIAERGIELSDKTRRITVRHALTMTNGMAHHPAMSGDWIGNYFRTPMAYEPGTRFAYNSSGTCLLGAAVLQATGQNMKDYLTDRLFRKIGIDPESFVWLKFPNQIDAQPGTFAKTEDNLRLAQLYLNGGSWNGEQILDPDFVKSALSVQIENPYAPEEKDGRCGYGYLLWACSIPGVFRFDGGQGQFGLIWPEKDLVVALHEGAITPTGPQKTLDTLYETLLLQLVDEPLSAVPEDYAALQTLQSSVHLPSDEPNRLPLNHSFAGSWRMDEGVFDPWMAVSPPGSGDLFAAFRSPEQNAPIFSFDLDVADDALTLSLSSGAVLRAVWDGTLTQGTVDTPFPGLGAYAATARFSGEHRLDVRIHWLNGWFETELSLELLDNTLAIVTRKLRLNPADNYLVETASAVREA